MHAAIYLHSATTGTEALAQQGKSCGEYLRTLNPQEQTWYGDQGADRASRDHMLEQVRKGKHDVVIVFDLDRLSRRAVDLQQIVLGINVAGAALHTVTSGQVGSPLLQAIGVMKRAEEARRRSEHGRRGALARRR